ncbi:VOC family protein [Streptosporangiaceae bacterium NEAU-GS5]|nr:VOC family protein [Streptosporangiaceae bacterium NEAU-GS5]
MAEFNGYKPGVPCWVDVSSADVEAAAAFYGELFGWQAEFDPRPDAGGYGQFTLRGKKVAGIGPVFQEGMPSVWNTYIAVTDAEKTSQAVREAGGQVPMEPMQVFEEGTLAIFQDPTGAFVGVWQPGNHKGAELANEPGAFSWNELATRDIDSAKAFYGSVFGWTFKTSDMGGVPYSEFEVEGNTVGGMMPMTDQYPPEVPPHWLVYFSVDSADAAHAKTIELGGGQIMPPFDIPIGRIAILSDPNGAPFAVFQAPQQ